jgi:hypothetical protein
MLFQDGVGESLEQWRMRKEEEPLILQQFLRKSFICTFYTYKIMAFWNKIAFSNRITLTLNYFNSRMKKVSATMKAITE